MSRAITFPFRNNVAEKSQEMKSHGTVRLADRRHAQILREHLDISNVRRTHSFFKTLVYKFTKPGMVPCVQKSVHTYPLPYGFFKHSYQIDEETRNYVWQVCEALEAFAAWSDLSDFAEQVKSAKDYFDHYTTSFDNGERFMILGLEVTMFHDRWIWNFASEIADELRLFLDAHLDV